MGVVNLIMIKVIRVKVGKLHHCRGVSPLLPPSWRFWPKEGIPTYTWCVWGLFSSPLGGLKGCMVPGSKCRTQKYPCGYQQTWVFLPPPGGNLTIGNQCCNWWQCALTPVIPVTWSPQFVWFPISLFHQLLAGGVLYLHTCLLLYYRGLCKIWLVSTLGRVCKRKESPHKCLNTEINH